MPAASHPAGAPPTEAPVRSPRGTAPAKMPRTMAITSVSLGALADLADRGDGADRAFVDAMIRMAWARGPGDHRQLEALHLALKAAALRTHAALRTGIADGALVGPALRRRFDEVAPLQRDHFVEEVLGIA